MSVALTPAPPRAASRGYDRSSLSGDYLVMIPDQTSEDFERDAPEDRFCEFFHGTIYMPSPVSDRHQDLVGFLFDVLNGFRHVGRPEVPIIVRSGPAVLRLSEGQKPEPDVFVRPRDVDHPKALLVIEVISRSYKKYDLEFKAAEYRNAGIPEVWYVDEHARTLYVDRKVGESYERTAHTTGRLDSTALPRFWIEVDWLWAEPLPNPRECLDRILA
jgi:Uma2 family endonuclease